MRYVTLGIIALILTSCDDSPTAPGADFRCVIYANADSIISEDDSGGHIIWSQSVCRRTD